MSSILASLTAPAQSANPGTKATVRSGQPDPNNPAGFGEALARSLKPAGEKIEKPAVKTASLAPARRQPGDKKTDPDDLVNALALSFIPIDSRPAKAALPDGAGTTEVSAARESVAALRHRPVAGTPVPAGEAGDAPHAPLLKNSGSTVLLTDAALPNKLDAQTPVSTGQTGNAPDADAQSRLASVLAAAASQKNAGQMPLQGSEAPATDGVIIQIDPLAVAAQAKAANAGLSDQSAKHDGKGADIPGESGNALADLMPMAPHGSKKITPNPATDKVEIAALAVSPAAIAVAADATTSTSAALTVSPVNVAMQAQGGVAASSEPASAATATLAPQVGSDEWGKALSQHVVQMGNAGHQVAELQLNPPGLGPLRVTLSMNDQQMQAMFVSTHSSVRAAVEAALPQLRASLAESGISLGNTSVGAESQQQQQQTAFANGHGGQPERGSYRPAWVSDTSALLTGRTASEPVRRNNGTRIDTYA